MSIDNIADRVARQAVVAKFIREAFGEQQANSLEQRAIRLLEEAIELAQACGVNQHKIAPLVHYIYSRPVGDITQEIGGVSVTLLGLCAAHRVSAEQAEKAEVTRVLSKPIEHFRARNQHKNDLGFIASDVEKTDV